MQDFVATFVQGTVAQGDLSPRRQMYKGQLSNDTLDQGDFCLRKFLPVISLLKIIFINILLDILISIN